MSQYVLRKDGDERLPIETMASELRRESEILRRVALSSILDLLDDLSRRLASCADAAALEGLAFLSFWLRRRNLESLVESNLHGGSACLENFVNHGDGQIKAQPRGLVCHWVAGNIPTLPMFSWVMSLLCKNVALLRVSEETVAATETLISILARTRGSKFSGEQALRTVRFVHFDPDDHVSHTAMSLAADCKVVWGGGTAVESISTLPKQHHSNEIIFGPKYSVGVICRETQEDRSRFERTLDAFVRDIVVFDQRACSSPQTIFIERSSRRAEAARDLIAERLDRATRAANVSVDPYTATRIYNTRAHWGLTPGRTFKAPIGAQWTVCLDSVVELKEAVQARTVFLVEVDDISQIAACMTPRVQTLGLAVVDDERAEDLADRCTARGVARCVRPGLMNVYDLPWDGRMVLSEMVNWVSLKR